MLMHDNLALILKFVSNKTPSGFSLGFWRALAHTGKTRLIVHRFLLQLFSHSQCNTDNVTALGNPPKFLFARMSADRSFSVWM